MKVCRFDNNRIGVVREDAVFDVTDVAEGVMHPQSTALGDPLICAFSLLQKAIGDDYARFTELPVSSVRLLSPVRFPTKVIAAPVNYHAHVKEMLESGLAYGHTLTDIAKAGLFLKANSALVGPSEGIALRFLERRTDHEVELAVVIGKTASEVSREAALKYVAGYALGLDITVRGSEDRSFRKSIDSYAVLGPWLVTADEIADPGNLHFSLSVDGVTKQDATTADMVYDVARLVEFASSFYTLYPGDVLYTGSPQGVGPIRPGNLLRATGELIGTMDVLVREFVAIHHQLAIHAD